MHLTRNNPQQLDPRQFSGNTNTSGDHKCAVAGAISVNRHIPSDVKLKIAVFYTGDIEKVEDFYNRVLGIDVEYRSEDKYISFIFPNKVTLGIKKAIEEREVLGKQSVFLEVKDIESWYRKAKELKVNILKELTHDTFGTNFSILDPDLNKVEFYGKK